MSHYLAIDIGAGSGAKIGVFDDALQSTRSGTLPRASYGTSPANLLDALAGAVRGLLAGMERPVAAGIACPGLVCSDGTFKPIVNLPFLSGIHIAQELHARLGIPGTALNDADAGALAEWNARRTELLYWVFGGGWGGAWVSDTGRILQPVLDWDGRDTSIHFASEPGYAIPLPRVDVQAELDSFALSFGQFEKEWNQYRQTAGHTLTGPDGRTDCIRAEAILSGPGRWILFRILSGLDAERTGTDTVPAPDRPLLADPGTAGSVITRLGKAGYRPAVQTDELFGRILARAAAIQFSSAERDGCRRDTVVAVAGGLSGALEAFGVTARNRLRESGYCHPIEMSRVAQAGMNPNLAGAALAAIRLTR